MSHFTYHIHYVKKLLFIKLREQLAINLNWHTYYLLDMIIFLDTNTFSLFKNITGQRKNEAYKYTAEICI